MKNNKYTTVDRIFSKLSRDLRDVDFNEDDVVEWIGEALEQLEVHSILKETICFLTVENYQAELPCNLHMIIQVARDNEYVKVEKSKCVSPKIIQEKVCDVIKSDTCKPKLFDCNGKPVDINIQDYTAPYFDLQLEYVDWSKSGYYNNRYTPVRLADHTFLNTIVCEEDRQVYSDSTRSVLDEYTIVGNNNDIIRTSFKDGSVAVAYLKAALDEKTGYPLIPDEISYITAITYYIKWKILEWHSWNGREGSINLLDRTYMLWNKYCGQAKAKAKMPKTIDDYQNLLEQQYSLVPNHNRYYGYFGKLSRNSTTKLNS